MTRSLKLFEKAVFEAGWNLLRVRCDALNEKSQNVPKKLGYVYEGTIRQDALNNDGRKGDMMNFSKLKSEWDKENA